MGIARLPLKPALKRETRTVFESFIATIAAAAPPVADIGILLTGLVLGIRHGIDWDHIAAITDITSTTASAGMAEAAHAGQHVDMGGHQHGHGGPDRGPRARRRTRRRDGRTRARGTPGSRSDQVHDAASSRRSGSGCCTRSAMASS